MGHIGRLWQVQSTYLNKRDMKRERKKIWKRVGEENKWEMRWQRLCLYSKESYHEEALTIIKAKCTRVIHEEVDEAINDDVAQLYGEVMQVIFHDNVFAGLNFSFIA